MVQDYTKRIDSIVAYKTYLEEQLSSLSNKINNSIIMSTEELNDISVKRKRLTNLKYENIEQWSENEINLDLIDTRDKEKYTIKYEKEDKSKKVQKNLAGDFVDDKKRIQQVRSKEELDKLVEELQEKYSDVWFERLKNVIDKKDSETGKEAPHRAEDLTTGDDKGETIAVKAPDVKIYKDFNGREAKRVFIPEEGYYKYYDVNTGNEVDWVIDFHTGAGIFVDKEKSSEKEPHFHKSNDLFEGNEHNDFEAIESIFNSRKGKSPTRENINIDIPLDKEKEKNDDEVLFNELDKTFADKGKHKFEPKENDDHVVGGSSNADLSKREKITPQLEDVEVAEDGSNKSPISNKFGISKIDIVEATGTIDVYDLEGNRISLEDIKKSNHNQKQINEAIDKMLDRLDEKYPDEKMRYYYDRRISKVLYKIASKKESSEIIDVVEQYIESILDKNAKMPFMINYNLKDIYNTDMSLAEIKKLQNISKIAQKQNKEMVDIEKDNPLKRAFGRIKKGIQERKENKLLNSGDTLKGKIKQGSKKVITGIYRNAKIHGMYLKGKLTREDSLRTKARVETERAKFVKDLRVNSKDKNSSEDKTTDDERLNSEFNGKDALDIDGNIEGYIYDDNPNNEVVVAPENKTKYEDEKVPKEGEDFVI